MKYMIASDIHGSAYYCKKMVEAWGQEGADRLILLGDLLYHGPRNDLPKDYAPKQVIPMLNALKDQLYVVRGNCDTEVDQMVLDFPIMADYAVFEVDGRAMYCTHGHIFHENHLPPLKKGDILLHGHTHILQSKEVDGIIILNPGSTSIPKGGNPATYAILKDRTFVVKTFEGEIVKEYQL